MDKHPRPNPARPTAGRPTPKRLYERYGAKPWDELPARTRDHYRKLVAAGIDGRGQPLAEQLADPGY